MRGMLLGYNFKPRPNSCVLATVYSGLDYNHWFINNHKSSIEPPPFLIYTPPPFRGGKLISPPSLLSPSPPLHTYSSQTINVEWSVVVYSGWKFPLLSVFSPMTFNFMCWIFSTFCSTVSVKIVGTFVCLLFPSLLVNKIWWLNHDKQLWEGQGEHRRKKTGFGPSVSTIFVWDCSFLWRIVTIFLLLEIAV